MVSATATTMKLKVQNAQTKLKKFMTIETIVSTFPRTICDERCFKLKINWFVRFYSGNPSHFKGRSQIYDEKLRIPFCCLHLVNPLTLCNDMRHALDFRIQIAQVSASIIYREYLLNCNCPFRYMYYMYSFFFFENFKSTYYLFTAWQI